MNTVQAPDKAEPASEPNIERLRELAAFYIKLDAALFAGIGTLLTFTRPERAELVDRLAQLQWGALALVVALGLALWTFHHISLDPTLGAGTDLKKRAKEYRSAARGLTFVLVTNVLVVLWITGIVFGAASAERDIRRDTQNRWWVQFAVWRYAEQHGHPAPNLDSAFISEPLAAQAYHELAGAAQVRYERVGARDYRLSFAGYDGRFGTFDDKVFTARDLPAGLSADKGRDSSR